MNENDYNNMILIRTERADEVKEIEYISDKYRNDYKFMRNFLINNPYLYGGVGEDLRFNMKLFMDVLKENQNVLYAPEAQYLLKKDDNALYIVKKEPFYVEALAKYIKDEQWDEAAKEITENFQ